MILSDTAQYIISFLLLWALGYGAYFAFEFGAGLAFPAAAQSVPSAPPIAPFEPADDDEADEEEIVPTWKTQKPQPAYTAPVLHNMTFTSAAVDAAAVEEPENEAMTTAVEDDWNDE